MDICEISNLDQLFIRGSYSQIKFSKQKKRLVAKLLFLWEAQSPLPVLFCLFFCFDRAVKPYFRRFMHQHKCAHWKWKKCFFPWKSIKMCPFFSYEMLPFFKKYGQAVLYGNVALSTVVLTTKKRYSSFSKQVFVFRKTCFRVKALKVFKFSSDCRRKYADLLNGVPF